MFNKHALLFPSPSQLFCPLGKKAANLSSQIPSFVRICSFEAFTEESWEDPERHICGDRLMKSFSVTWRKERLLVVTSFISPSPFFYKPLFSRKECAQCGQETMNKAAFLVSSVHVKVWLWISERLQNRLKNSDFFLCVAYGPRDGGALWDQKGRRGCSYGQHIR